MVTQRKYVAIEEVVKLLKKIPPESVINELKNLSARQPAPPCPEGGISLSDASRKYKIHHQTISRWVAAGVVPIILRTSKQLYVDEAVLTQVIHTYKKKPGRGQKTVKRNFKAA